ncbi:acyl-coenzyme A diphosphatase NUDT19-like [Hetaerina americana]|uniref:acyl-coenzyme A diphosphatase NUDT19-like n=1 Tax=Hetaerina americana TaxID=62018 RepID=UPI003A7F124D
MSNSVKKAASVIVFGKSVFLDSISSIPKRSNVGEKHLPPVDYKILVVKRSSKSSFMPNGIVFPGGIYHEADACRDWLKLYREMNMCPSLKTSHLGTSTFLVEKKIRTNNALCFSNHGDCLPSNVAFRITAIRELFEECGLLLAKKATVKIDKEGSNSGWSSFLHSHEILQWQQRVQRNPREFIKLCEEFMCVPDVWGLKDWSIWLTPKHLPSKRFDTTFFVAALNQIPPTVPDGKELSELKWEAPDQLLDEYRSQGIWLPPPQCYELARIAKNFHQINQFLDYSKYWCGCPRWMPVGIKAADGWVYVLPGDDMYPAEPDFFNVEDVKKEKNRSELQMAELRNNCIRLHRMEIKDTYSVNIVISHNPSTDHVYPEQSFKKESCL